MADLFVTFVAIVPKPSTVTVSGPRSTGGATPNNGLFTSLQNQQLLTPGK